MPNFSTALITDLENNKVDSRHVLSEIRLHIKQVTDDTYLKKSEMDLLCSSLVEEYPALADPDSNGKGSVSNFLDCTSSLTFYLLKFFTCQLHISDCSEEKYSKIIQQ